MLGKLLKYDFKALSRVLLPLQGGVLLAGIIGCFLVNFSYRSFSSSLSANYYSLPYSSYSQKMPFEDVLNATSSMLAGLFFAAVFASAWVTIFLIGRHFYKSFLKDEGYLSFTLPVTTTQNMLSKIIAGSIWLLINAVILTFIVILLTLIGFSDTGLFNAWVVDFYGEIFGYLSNTPGAVFIIEMIVLALLVLVSNVLQIYASLVIGASIARTHKVLAGIGIYVAIYMVIQTLLSFVSFGFILGMSSPSFGTFSENSWFYYAQGFAIPLLIIYGVLNVVFFFVSRHLLNTKLNLD